MTGSFRRDLFIGTALALLLTWLTGISASAR